MFGELYLKGAVDELLRFVQYRGCGRWELVRMFGRRERAVFTCTYIYVGSLAGKKGRFADRTYRDFVIHESWKFCSSHERVHMLPRFLGA